MLRDVRWTGQRNPTPALHPDGLAVGYVRNARMFLKELNLRPVLGCINMPLLKSCDYGPEAVLRVYKVDV